MLRTALWEFVCTRFVCSLVWFCLVLLFRGVVWVWVACWVLTFDFGLNVFVFCWVLGWFVVFEFAALDLMLLIVAVC